MIGLPSYGQKVVVYPFPGRTVQASSNPVDRWGGGSFLPESGREVVWSAFHHDQLKAGDLLLHPPHPADPALAKNAARAPAPPAPAKFDHARATQEHVIASAPPKAAKRAEISDAAAAESRAKQAEKHARLAREEAARAVAADKSAEGAK